MDMPNTRAGTAKSPTGKATSVDLFPLAQYASVLGVHLILVGFTALYLPQTTRLFAPFLAAEKTDRVSDFMETLTADPSLTLSRIFAGLTILEVWWASWMRKWSFAQTAKGAGVDRDSLHLSRLRDATAFTACAALATHVVVVLFGAPLTTHILQTALLALVTAVLTVFTPAFVLGLPSLASDTPSMVSRLTWTRLFAELAPRDAVECAMVYPAVGTFVGGWLGAIPVALDWDCPWQAWPLTPLFGSLGGYIVGAILAFAFTTTKWLATQHIKSLSSKRKSN